MSDFVTVDEVGDVAELPLKRSEEGETPPTCVPQDTPQVASPWLCTQSLSCMIKDVSADALLLLPTGVFILAEVQPVTRGGSCNFEMIRRLSGL